MNERGEKFAMENDREVAEAITQGRESGATSSLDARAALVDLCNHLAEGNGYYVWTSLGDDSLATWQLRIPRTDREDEPWMRAEAAELVHLCQPAKYMEAFHKREKERLSSFTGYVRDSKCTTCSREMPTEQERRGEMQVKLHSLGRKV